MIPPPAWRPPFANHRSYIINHKCESPVAFPSSIAHHPSSIIHHPSSPPILSFLRSLFTRVPRIAPHEAAPRLRAGNALLIDVREASETTKGVVESAVALPLTDLLGSRRAWAPFLADLRGRDMILYCGAGARSGMAARILTREGYTAINGGSMSAWTKAGWKIEST